MEGLELQEVHTSVAWAESEAGTGSRAWKPDSKLCDVPIPCIPTVGLQNLACYLLGPRKLTTELKMYLSRQSLPSMQEALSSMAIAT